MSCVCLGVQWCVTPVHGKEDELSLATTSQEQRVIAEAFAEQLAPHLSQQQTDQFLAILSDEQLERLAPALLGVVLSYAYTPVAQQDTSSPEQILDRLRFDVVLTPSRRSSEQGGTLFAGMGTGAVARESHLLAPEMKKNHVLHLYLALPDAERRMLRNQILAVAAECLASQPTRFEQLQLLKPSEQITALIEDNQALAFPPPSAQKNTK